jgi:alpha/beta superfamily hydrolase
MKQQSITFKSHGLSIEGIVTLPINVNEPFSGVVLAHAHPLFGENMSSPIMITICEFLDKQGIATMRFNFRGVGESQGQFDRGDGEQKDLRSALSTFKNWPKLNKKKIGLLGLSFGAHMSMSVVPKEQWIAAIAMISPPTKSLDKYNNLSYKGPRLLIDGDMEPIKPTDSLGSDSYSPFALWEAQSWNKPETDIAQDVADFFSTSFR